MSGERAPGVLGRDPFAAESMGGVMTLDRGGLASPTPVGIEPAEPEELDSGEPKVARVTKDWADPPRVTPTFTPEVSGKTLAAVLEELEKLAEWGTGGGNLEGTGADGEIQAVISPDGKSYTIALKGKFFLTLPKWKEYGAATKGQKAAWDAMIVNLRKHETEHVLIAARAYNKLVGELKGIPGSLAIQKIADAQTSGQALQDDFDSDEKTSHGHKTWQTFPKVELDTSADPEPAPE